jgi:hypothetical protein
VGNCDVLPVLDTRLVAAVQAGAGARCHEAAGLLQGYYLWLKLYRMAVEHGADDVAEVAEMFRQTKVRLRAFLTVGAPTCPRDYGRLTVRSRMVLERRSSCNTSWSTVGSG